MRRWEVLSEELGADVEYRQQAICAWHARRRKRTPCRPWWRTSGRWAGPDLPADTQSVRERWRQRSPSMCTARLAAPTATPAQRPRCAFADAAARHGATIITGTGVDHASSRTIAGSSAWRQTPGHFRRRGRRRCRRHLFRQIVRDGRRAAAAATIHVSAVQTVPLPPMLGQVLGVANADFAGRQEADGRLRMTISTGDWHHPPARLRDEIQPPAYMVSTIIERGVRPAGGARARINRVWGGLLDMTPDGLPVIERTWRRGADRRDRLLRVTASAWDRSRAS